MAQALADAAEGIDAGVDQPQWRTLPELADLAVGDMVAVTGHDLLAAARAAGPERDCWTRRGRAPVAGVVDNVAALLAAVRRAI